jgi:hypothetical protein
VGLAHEGGKRYIDALIVVISDLSTAARAKTSRWSRFSLALRYARTVEVGQIAFAPILPVVDLERRRKI